LNDIPSRGKEGGTILDLNAGRSGADSLGVFVSVPTEILHFCDFRDIRDIYAKRLGVEDERVYSVADSWSRMNDGSVH
jgi:hypothetical protein